MARSTEAELEGVPWGAIGAAGGPVALQSALDKFRKPEPYQDLASAQDSLATGEAALVTIAGVPTLLYRDAHGAYFSKQLTAL